MRRLPDVESAQARKLIREMATLTEDGGYRFDPAWLLKHRWVVVPAEDSGHFADEEISRIVAVLSSQEHLTCLAIGAHDWPAPLPRSYELAISVDDFRAFNAECGIFRFLLTDAGCSWAISCNEWFNLFAGPPAFVEQMLGVPIPQSREEFLEYAKLVEQGSEGQLTEIARLYE
jgi:hypothetical protein